MFLLDLDSSLLRRMPRCQGVYKFELSVNLLGSLVVKMENLLSTSMI